MSSPTETLLQSIQCKICRLYFFCGLGSFAETKKILQFLKRKNRTFTFCCVSVMLNIEYLLSFEMKVMHFDNRRDLPKVVVPNLVQQNIHSEFP